MNEEEVRTPSLLPGWSRAHVVTHLARNADGLSNLLTWARTGIETPQYSSWEQRNLDIDSGSARPLVELVEDSRAAAERFMDEASRVVGEQWDVPVRTMSSPTHFPARDVLLSRRTEVEVHHADLGTGYRAGDWPEDFTSMLIARVGEDRSDGPAMVLLASDGVGGPWRFGQGRGPEITGRAADLAWWLIGRGDRSRLTSSTGEVPELAKWR